VFAQYTQAFQALDARAVAQHFHEPAFFITPKEVLCLPTIETVEHTYSAFSKPLNQAALRMSQLRKSSSAASQSF
jgi:hypothetical protein